MIYLTAFLVGGGICALAQLIKDYFKLTTGHMTALFVTAGVFLDIGNFYDKLLQAAGAGAMLPITSFGHALADASISKAREIGYIGIFTGIFDKTAGGIALAFFLAIIIGMIFRPKR
ncbi:MAG: SpoVA/SpoVAEb family sporulation membrane protein [Anaeroplasma sp.]